MDSHAFISILTSYKPFYNSTDYNMVANTKIDPRNVYENDRDEGMTVPESFLGLDIKMIQLDFFFFFLLGSI